MVNHKKNTLQTIRQTEGIGFPQNKMCVTIFQLYSANASNQNFKIIISFKENNTKDIKIDTHVKGNLK